MTASRAAALSLVALLAAAALSALPGCRTLASLVSPEQPPAGEAADSLAAMRPDDTVAPMRRPPDTDSLTASPGLPSYDPRSELIDARHLCEGRRRAVVVIDPRDPQNLRGCVRLPSGMRGYVDALNEFTSLHAVTDGLLYATDDDLLSMPFLGSLALPDRQSAANLVHYLERGGFLLQGVSPALKRGLQRGGWSEGVDYWVESLPLDHPVFHCYFDLTDPSSADGVAAGRGFQTLGTYLDGRLIAITGMPGGSRGTINLLVYALIREGSLAERYFRGNGAR